ncbi:hypothetical protein M5J15_11060 [Serratia symbiotica]|uniref:hypothetical protein n=1 Tax=Serratia symbiotica TaxID=138074 RepID=UPI002090EA0C|nr:hypothetical protein [Serratia symbiotica]USS95155.1 hypothetical protein M5J15_11060 [Serratia symbiotica]
MEVLTYLDGIGECVSLAPVCVVDGQFADIGGVIPKENSPVDAIGFNAGYLADIEKAAKLYNPKSPGIVIKPSVQTTSSIVELSDTFEKASAVIMPIRL